MLSKEARSTRDRLGWTCLWAFGAYIIGNGFAAGVLVMQHRYALAPFPACLAALAFHWALDARDRMSTTHIFEAMHDGLQDGKEPS
jgi:hypothetical protein